MTKLLNLDAVNNLRLYHGIIDDFDWYVTAHLWTITATDAGAVTQNDAAGGTVSLTMSDGTVADNDEVYLATSKEVFKFADDKPLVFETRIQFAEANTDDANVCVGLKDAVAANSILDDGGGPSASYSGVTIFKVDGSTVWQCESSLAGTQITTVSQHTAGGTTPQVLRIEWMPFSTTQAHVTFFIDGKPMLDANGKPIMHTMTYTSATEMQAFVGGKNGGANLETLVVDYIAAVQKR